MWLQLCLVNFKNAHHHHMRRNTGAVGAVMQEQNSMLLARSCMDFIVLPKNLVAGWGDVDEVQDDL